MIARFLLATAGLATAGVGTARTRADLPVRTHAQAVQPATGTPPRTILFVGNSFTFGALSPVRNWHADRVVDLNGTGIGGVPALFDQFARDAGLDYAVSLETQGGKTLGFHYDERRALIDRRWDVVVLQEYSTLSPTRPGDDSDYRRDVGRLSKMLRARNARVQVQLLATWTRADAVYRPGTPWSGKPITAMAVDLRTAANRARAQNPGVAGVLPVGQAWNRAFATGLADINPYDGIGPGQIDLWSYDHYHASVFGYYLEALVAFGRITGVDPRTLGERERAADELGIAPDTARMLQQIAQEELTADRPR